MTSNSVKVGLIVVIILLVAILGTMTGFVTKPPTETTTTMLTTQPTTTTMTSSKCIEIHSPTPCRQDSDCCSGNCLRHYGSKENIKFRENGTCENKYCGDYVCSSFEDCESCPFDCGICQRNIALVDAVCRDEFITMLVKNDGNSPITSLIFIVNELKEDEISGCMNNPLLPNKTITCQLYPVSKSNDIRIVGPANAVGGRVECETISKLITMVDVYCRNGKITTLIKNDGNAIITDDEIKVYMNDVDKTDKFDIKTIIPQNTEIISSSATLITGSYEIRVIGPSNAVGGTVNC
jgi:hypothetical protein